MELVMDLMKYILFKKMSEKQTTSSGLGIGTILFLIFLTLKLAEIGPVQYWSWWWVTAPLWIPLGIGVGIMAIAIITAFIGYKMNK